VGTDASTIQSVTPSDIFTSPAIDVQLTWQSERTGRENNWYSLTGRVVAVEIEADADLHIALQDATGDKPGIIVCEVPAQEHKAFVAEQRKVQEQGATIARQEQQVEALTAGLQKVSAKLELSKSAPQTVANGQ
jgi:hypothetical protein